MFILSVGRGGGWGVGERLYLSSTKVLHLWITSICFCTHAEKKGTLQMTLCFFRTFEHFVIVMTIGQVKKL